MSASVDIARGLRPSARGELEIIDLNRAYLQAGALHVTPLDRGIARLDTGTFTSMMQASELVRVIEERQGMKVGGIEEAVRRTGLIDDDRLRNLAQPLIKSGYGDYLLGLLAESRPFVTPQRGVDVPKARRRVARPSVGTRPP